MATLTIPLVRSWDPAALSTAAQTLETARTDLDHEVNAIVSAMDTASLTWQGQAADAAATRVAQEAAAGREVSAAVDLARAALSTGSTELTTTRSHLLGVVSDATALGFTVSDSGSVTAPTLPPVMTAPGDTTALEARNARQTELNEQARAHATTIGAALTAVRQADEGTAIALMAVEVPASLSADVESLIERLRNTGTAILGAGAGAIALGMTLQKAWSVFGKTSAYAKWISATGGMLRNVPGSVAFLTGATKDASAFARFATANKAASAALRELQFGKTAGFLGRIPFIGGAATKFMGVVGKAFLPLTVATGLLDAVTGGGYEGARGWATRGAGLAGAAGAGALLASSAGLIALGPVGLGIAGAAVVGYGAWTLGNMIYDNWGEITDFTGKAAGWVADTASAGWNWAGDRVSDASGWTVDRVNDAKDWAGDRLEDAGKMAKDAGKAVADTGKAVLEGGKKLADGALNVISLGFL